MRRDNNDNDMDDDIEGGGGGSGSRGNQAVNGEYAFGCRCGLSMRARMDQAGMYLVPEGIQAKEMR